MSVNSTVASIRSLRRKSASLDIRDDPRQTDEGDLALTKDLVGDVRLAIARIPRLGHPRR
jgi:hypothetical protein